jgi:hypothetical protein
MNTTDKLIYYPGFEITDADWAKFALLYLDSLSPIVPFAGDRHLSKSFRKLREETDLIVVHRPNYHDGKRATLDALDQVEKILMHPERYRDIFKRQKLVSAWKRPQSHKIELFHDKYTEDWEKFCISQKLATPSKNGIYISKDLADVYMTILAQAIADSNGASVITDNRSLDTYSVFIRKADHADQGVFQTAQGVFNLKLPRNLTNISLDAVIMHRNRPGFRQKQRAFRRALNEALSDAEKGGSPEKFLNSLGSAWSDLSDDILKVGTGTVTFGLGVWLVLASPSVDMLVDMLKVAKEVAAGTTLAVGSIVGVRNVWRNTNTKRLARRFVSDLKKISTEEPVQGID